MLLAVLALLALTGCTRVQVALAVQPDDTVDGTIVVATPEGAPDGRGPQLEVPADLAGEVELLGKSSKFRLVLLTCLLHTGFLVLNIHGSLAAVVLKLIL